MTPALPPYGGARYLPAPAALPHRQEVIVKDIQMSFGSMVAFMVKWAIAAIPAAIILATIGALVFAVFSALFAGVLAALMHR